MLIDTLQNLFNRDLLRLRKEIELYSNEANLWKTGDGISNSAGNLCLHLIGNLNTYIGKEIGNTGYVRNRDAEFALKDIPRHQLLEMVDATITTVRTSLNGLNENALADEYPVVVFDERMSSEFFLMHLTTHLNYHLGQINYHRRLMDK